MDLRETYASVADAVRRASGLVLATGAGMGVDSGLPDFRGERGFWNAYPMYERLGLRFVDAANPARFEDDPAFGWGFYGHRLGLYRATVPHRGYALVRDWVERFRIPFFAVTSNVDGQLQKAGFDGSRVAEVHGSIHHLQCTSPCSDDIWENEEEVRVDLDSMRALAVPRCRRCSRVARPNILMFGDGSWLPGRSEAQGQRLEAFLEAHGEGLLVLEIGAGTAVATIRLLTERLSGTPGARAVRVNPREADIRPPHLSVAAGALEALAAVDEELRRKA